MTCFCKGPKHYTCLALSFICFCTGYIELLFDQRRRLSIRFRIFSTMRHSFHSQISRLVPQKPFDTLSHHWYGFCDTLFHPHLHRSGQNSYHSIGLCDASRYTNQLHAIAMEMGIILCVLHSGQCRSTIGAFDIG